MSKLHVLLLIALDVVRDHVCVVDPEVDAFVNIVYDDVCISADALADLVVNLPDVAGLMTLLDVSLLLMLCHNCCDRCDRRC